jgi:hypothetical protein
MPGNGIRQFPFAIACMGDYRMAAIHTIMVEPSSIALMPMLRSIAPGSACPGVESGSSAAASREFAEPPLNARPGSFWDWLNGSITREQITRDLTAMKLGGMRGGEIWDVAAYADPDRRVPAGPAFLGPESTQLIVHAIREADRLGLEIGIVASSGWNAGGSWIPRRSTPARDSISRPPR